jgi:hypothetical protein
MQTMDRRFSVENIPHNITYYFLNHLAVNVERVPYMQMCLVQILILTYGSAVNVIGVTTILY